MLLKYDLVLGSSGGRQVVPVVSTWWNICQCSHLLWRELHHLHPQEFFYELYERPYGDLDYVEHKMKTLDLTSYWKEFFPQVTVWRNPTWKKKKKTTRPPVLEQ